MHNAQALLTPPSTPPPHQQFRCPSTPESRIGKLLGASLQLKGILGTGAYGVVYSAVDLYTQNWYAVKALSKTNANGQPLDHRQQDFQQREIKLHFDASAHPNILSMLKIVDDPECTYVILEYCPEGDLFSNITEKGRYVNNDAMIKRAFGQIVDAVEHCHRLGIYHRDLKPENILVSHSGLNVLLADFGLATKDAESEDHGCGSTFYMSPECLDQSSRKPSYRCAPNDIWSLGVILVNLTCGRNPWKQASVEDATYRAFTRSRDFLKTILPLSDELNDILGLIFERDAEKRITIDVLKQRIRDCRYFTAQSQQLSTPPASPEFAPQVYPGDESYDSLSDDGSIISDEGSLTGSCSTVSSEGESELLDPMEPDQDTIQVVDPTSSPASYPATCWNHGPEYPPSPPAEVPKETWYPVTPLPTIPADSSMEIKQDLSTTHPYIPQPQYPFLMAPKPQVAYPWNSYGYHALYHGVSYFRPQAPAYRNLAPWVGGYC